MIPHRVYLVVSVFTLTIACQSTHVAPINTATQPLTLAADEQKLWDEAQRLERRIEAVGLVYSNAELETYIRSIAAQLISKRLENPETELRVRILRIPYRNAFVFPNGVFYITTGLLACLDSEAELALVFGHETTHFIHRDALRETRGAANKRIFADILGGTGVLTGLGPVFNGIGSAWATAAILGYSRDLEREADEQGLEELVQAGYDLQAALKPLECFREEEDWEGSPAKNRRSTHPATAERIDYYRELLATRYAEAVREPGRRTNRDQYLTHVKQVLLDNAVLDLAIDRPDFAQHAVDKYVTQWPDCARGYFSRGEICRRRRGSDALVQAEIAYCEAARLDASYAEPHRELGLLYRGMGRLQEARDEFAAYVSLAAKEMDIKIFQRYVAEINAQLEGAAPP